MPIAKKLIYITTGFIFSILMLQNAMAANADFETCTNRLYAVGGMSKTDAVFICYEQVSTEILDCQNKKFLLDFEEPKAAFQLCAKSAETSNYDRASLYRGSFEATPPKDNRKTICSITVNSTEEREAFRKELNPNDYSWVELLPFNLPENAGRFMVRDNQWLKRACEKKVRCDTVVISGHFASSFIGSSGYEVKLEDLTKFSCDQGCKDLFESVKHVYLFGCNTLATNAADSRTISQYVEILIQDGVAPHEAQRIAARRYTKYGQTISDEFRKVFPKAEQIFGYSRPGPTGSHIKPVLTKYLKNLSNIPEDDKDALKANFANTLGKTGMEVVARLPRDPMTCSNEKNLVRDPALKTKEGLLSFVKKYSLMIPVAVVDLISEAKDKNFITNSESDQLMSSVVKNFDGKNVTVKRHLLCPLLATKNIQVIPRELACLKTLGTPEDRNSWVFSRP